MANEKNVKIGMAAVWIKAYAIDSTNNPFSANTIDTTGWTQLGYQTTDGSTIAMSEELYNVLVPEMQAFVAGEIQQQGYTVKFGLIESDIVNQEYALSGFTYAAGATPGTNPDTLKFGYDSIDYYSLLIIAPGADQNGAAANIGYFCRKVAAMGTTEVASRKSKERETQFEFQGYADRDDSVAADEQFIIAHQLTVA